MDSDEDDPLLLPKHSNSSPTVKLERLKRIFRSKPVHETKTTAVHLKFDHSPPINSTGIRGHSSSGLKTYQNFSEYATGVCQYELSKTEEINIEPHISLLNSKASGLYAYQKDRILLEKSFDLFGSANSLL